VARFRRDRCHPIGPTWANSPSPCTWLRRPLQAARPTQATAAPLLSQSPPQSRHQIHLPDVPTPRDWRQCYARGASPGCRRSRCDRRSRPPTWGLNGGDHWGAQSRSSNSERRSSAARHDPKSEVCWDCRHSLAGMWGESRWVATSKSPPLLAGQRNMHASRDNYSRNGEIVNRDVRTGSRVHRVRRTVHGPQGGRFTQLLVNRASHAVVQQSRFANHARSFMILL
jgi:hypothetical protein